MSCKVQQSVCSDCVTYAKSRIKFNTLNTFNNVEKNYGFDQNVNGKPLEQSLAELIERNERNEIELERAKVSIAVYRQMNNLSRLKLEAAKFELAAKQFELKNKA